MVRFGPITETRRIGLQSTSRQFCSRSISYTGPFNGFCSSWRLTIVHKCINVRVPAYLTCHWIICQCHRRPGLRSSSDESWNSVDQNDVRRPILAFAVDGPRVWNSVPNSLCAPSLLQLVSLLFIPVKI